LPVLCCRAPQENEDYVQGFELNTYQIEQDQRCKLNKDNIPDKLMCAFPTRKDVVEGASVVSYIAPSGQVLRGMSAKAFIAQRLNWWVLL